MDKTLKIAVAAVILVVIGCAAVLLTTHTTAAPTTPSAFPVQQAAAPGNPTVYFFYGQECPHCANIEPLITKLAQAYPDVGFQSLETWHNATNADLMTQMDDQLNISKDERGVPEVIVSGNDTPLIGDRAIPAQLESAILAGLKKNP